MVAVNLVTICQAISLATGSGIAMLLLSCTFIGLLLTVPWSLIDMIRYLIMGDDEFAERYARRPR